MYGKAYESMYEGSMVGSGIEVFAVWNYIIAKNREGHIEINPKLLAFTLGGTEDQINSALDFLQEPDPESRSKAEGGRRLLKEGQFQYRVVNWEYYQRIKNEADRREYNRLKQAEYRKNKSRKTKPTNRGSAFVSALNAGASEQQLSAIATEGLPNDKTKTNQIPPPPRNQGPNQNEAGGGPDHHPGPADSNHEGLAEVNPPIPTETVGSHPED